MKCHSLACLWSGPPPLHRVTATAVLTDPQTLYTGGSDGSIIWWNISSSQEVRPMAMLCGHAAAIADLCICEPMAAPMDEAPESAVRSFRPSLFSACLDGVLCVWSRGSGHCRRRRRLPPWAGSPHMLSSLPTSPRFVCIVCSSADRADPAVHGSSSQVVSVDRDGIEREACYRKSSKYAIVIVDSYSLSIVRTVFHGGLSMGPVKCMAVVRDLRTRKTLSAVIADAFGKVRSFILQAENDQDVEVGNILQKSASSEALNLIASESSIDDAVAVSVSARGTWLVLLYSGYFTVHSMLNRGIYRHISLDNSPLCNPCTSSGVRVTGGTFLQDGFRDEKLVPKDIEEGSIELFAIWNSNGATVIYSLKLSEASLGLEPVCQIPSFSHMLNPKTSVQICQLGRYLVRVESFALDVSGSLLWRPHVSLWVVSQQPHVHVGGSEGLCVEAMASDNPDGTHLCVQKGEGGFADNNKHSWASLRRILPNNKEECYGGVPHENYSGSVDSHLWDRNTVSSCIILSKNVHMPYAVVYGFYSGEIEVNLLENLFTKLNPTDGLACPDTGLHVPHYSLSGHTGAVLCLAAHHMVAASTSHNAVWILISGGLDGTVRIWDLDSGNIIVVMHHHIAPVRQIVLPPSGTDHPWGDCFLSVGEDSCVALSCLDTLHVERMFPGHPYYPSMVAWDSIRGYVACLCRNLSLSDHLSSLYIWDVKSGARERILHGTASFSMFDHFCKSIHLVTSTSPILGGTTSVPSLLLPLNDDMKVAGTYGARVSPQKDTPPCSGHPGGACHTDSNNLLNNSKVEPGVFIKNEVPSSSKHLPPLGLHQKGKCPIRCYCPFPEVAAFEFDLHLLMSLCQISHRSTQTHDNLIKVNKSKQESHLSSAKDVSSSDVSEIQCTEHHPSKETLDIFLLRFSLSFLHLWGIDNELDKLLVSEMGINKPGPFVASGVLGDRGSLTLIFPDMHSSLELWKCSSEFCAMRSLTMVSLAQRLVYLSISSSTASSDLAAFYTRNFAEKLPDIRPPLLQVLVSFWQHPSEHVRMAARSLFHCAAPRAIPRILYCQIMIRPANSSNPTVVVKEHSQSNEDVPRNLVPDSMKDEEKEDLNIVRWLESYEVQDWVSCIGGTAQDAMTSQIIVAAALAVWYPSIVKSSVAKLVVDRLVKLVMSMNEYYSSTAAELLAEGMDSTWKALIGPEIPHLTGDVFFLIECLSSGSAGNATQNPAVAMNIRETLVGILLPSLAMADVNGFLTIIEGHIWSMSSDSPVHLVSLNTLIRVVRGSPKTMLPYIDKVVNYVLQTIDHGNVVMRKVCIHSSMAALREIARVFPMVDLNGRTSRLAVGDAIGDVNNVTIQVYDIQSVTKIKVLDASGPPGFPSLLSKASDTVVTAAISALIFSPDGEGLVAFSEHGLTIRWWSLGSAWWEKLSRSSVPVQCTKLIFVPPWEGLSPNSSRSSIIANITGHHNQTVSQEKTRESKDSDSDRLQISRHNVDLSYRLEWVDGRKVILTRHGQELGCFQL